METPSADPVLAKNLPTGSATAGLQPKTAGWAIKIATIAVIVMHMMLSSYGYFLPIQRAYFFPYGLLSIGTDLLFSLGFTLIVFLPFQIGKRFRTQRSRWLIILGANSFLLYIEVKKIIDFLLKLLDQLSACL
jgi:peptidoglycan/LPS O-acetylase OafA/YrhL